MSNELPDGRHDITISRPGVIDIRGRASALQLHNVEAHMEIETRWRSPQTGHTASTYQAGWDRQERAVITTEWKEAEHGR